MNLKDTILEMLPSIKAVRQELHKNAELAFQEYKTRSIILNFLKPLELDIRHIAKTGIAATMNNTDKCIALRVDMDALPINGVSHLCGHDYHMAIALGTAQTLKNIGFDGCIKFIFQPAEEADGGALPMIDDGVLHNPTVEYIIGFHVWPEVEVGKIEVSPGASMASVDDFHITFKGKGGHAALPHKCINPIYPSIEFINTINTKSRIEHNPLEPHLVTISAINSGTVPNVIENTSKVLGTVRTFDNRVRKLLQRDIVKCAELSAEKYNCTVDIDYQLQYPPLISKPELTERFIDCTKNLIGDDNVLPLKKTFAAEDFSFFAEKVSSVHFRLGICDGEKGTHALHNPAFDASDDALFYGIYIITNFILDLYKDLLL
jgi:amidohydrolase